MVEKYLPRIEALGDQRRLSRFLFETGYAHVFGARQDICRPLLERALEIGQEIDDEVAIAYTKMGLMWHYIYWEPASVARRETVNRLGEEAIEVGRRIGDVWLTSKAMVARGNEAAMWGRPDEAVVFDLQLLELSRETGDPRPRGMGLWRLAYLTVISGDPRQGIEHADEALNLSMSPIDRLYARGAKAFAMVLMGRAGEALEILEEMRRITAAGNLLIVNFITVDLPYGMALVIAGRMAEGVAHIEAKTRAFEQLGQPLAQIWSSYYLGEIYLEMVLSKERPPITVILKNLGFILKTAPFAARRARERLSEAVASSREHDIPYLLAAGLFGLGRLDVAASARTRRTQGSTRRARSPSGSKCRHCKRISTGRSPRFDDHSGGGEEAIHVVRASVGEEFGVGLGRRARRGHVRERVAQNSVGALGAQQPIRAEPYHQLADHGRRAGTERRRIQACVHRSHPANHPVIGLRK